MKSAMQSVATVTVSRHLPNWPSGPKWWTEGKDEALVCFFASLTYTTDQLRKPFTFDASLDIKTCDASMCLGCIVAEDNIVLLPLLSKI
jgi:hypothetical protein